mmetsp:Transcript_1423/g.2588  ORF Transcript_1423/g.2588 Transcript_1423/m.2588 type:complete len:91 (+) Transcript_1423:432-704(+)
MVGDKSVRKRSSDLGLMPRDPQQNTISPRQAHVLSGTCSPALGPDTGLYTKADTCWAAPSKGDSRQSIVAVPAAQQRDEEEKEEQQQEQV